MKEGKIGIGGPEKKLGGIGRNADLAQAVDLGGLAQGPPKPDYLDDISARRSSARIFSGGSGSVARLKANLGLDLEPLGRPRLSGGSAGPKSPCGILP